MFPTLIIAVTLCMLQTVRAGTLNRGQIKAITDELKQSLTISSKKPPYYDKTFKTEPSCVSHYFSCHQTEFFYRHFLRKVYSIDIVYTSHTERKEYNTNNKPLTFKVTTSTTNTVSSTSGWNIGGKVSGTISPIELEINGDFSKSDTTSHSETSTVENDVTCDPGYECSIDTLTFYAVISGLCSTEPYVRCEEEGNICLWKSPLGCGQYVDHYNRNCFDGRHEIEPLNCNATFPIYDDTGKPLSRILVSSKKLAKKAAL
ncbi:hypothetical protein QQS21_004876 [Conoideocrella luteorostrata]|uniref:Uncharacterized protein n=1 Tax=Conoideocrella luteorostrata TaxID=1105319 RepID=A0AAJ0FUA0_9HYPO|nr:hypothetical protein QQS21_004876 [Conoideocrella luteorostrata]